MFHPSLKIFDYTTASDIAISVTYQLVPSSAKLEVAAVICVLNSSNENKRLVSITFDKNSKLWKAFESHAEESTYRDIENEEAAAAEVEEMPDDRSCDEAAEAGFHNETFMIS